MKILAIDSMSTYATYDGEEAHTYSTKSACKEYSFYDNMLDVIRRGQYDVVVFEETVFPYINSQRIMFGQLAIIKVICHGLKTKVDTMAPTQAKKLFTGSGKSKKDGMKKECDKRGIKYKNEHEADAIGIYHAYKIKHNIK